MLAWIITIAASVVTYMVSQIISYEPINHVFKIMTRLHRQSLLSDGCDYDHIFRVLEHARLATASYEEVFHKLSPKQKATIELACLLYDVYNEDPEIAKDILRDTFPELKRSVIQCCQVIPTIGNGNHIDPLLPAWQYIPRYSNRLESTGQRGIERCLKFCAAGNIPLRVGSTPDAVTVSDIEDALNKERFRAYCSGKSPVSVIDYFYDNLLHLYVKTGIPYVDAAMQDGHLTMLDWVLAQHSEW